jgi:lipopolysaccharide/colanic/teichoic acid biosynthesis glycosyltransferase
MLYRPHGKRALDLALVIPAGILLAPVAAAVAAAVAATQGRPVLFTQRRVGRDDAEFTLYKFRTMVEDAERSGAGLWFTRDDPRVTPLGRVLRSWSLDELPQLWNVLRGDMSIVGPRPKPREIVDRYRSRYLPTLAVPPGLTCYTAIRGRNRLRRSQMIAYDREYVRDAGLLTDLSVILRTIPVVLLRTGFQAEDESEEWIEDVPAEAGG